MPLGTGSANGGLSGSAESGSGVAATLTGLPVSTTTSTHRTEKGTAMAALCFFAAILVVLDFMAQARPDEL